MFEYIKSDLIRYYGKVDIFTFFKAYFKNPTFRFQCAFRLCHGTGLAKKLGLFLWKLNKTKRTIQLPLRTQVGFGLYIGHGGPIVINPTTIIGNNCNLSQFTTIGSNEGKAAIIGDNTYIGPNVCIVGNVKIGNNVTIGAGSVVTKDIPDNATAVGNYAKVINYNNPGRYVNNRWNDVDYIYNKMRKWLNIYDSYENIYFYGAGEIGMRFLTQLEYFGMKPKAFIETDCEEGKKVNNIPVYSIDNIQLGDNDMVIISVGYKLRRQIRRELKKRKIVNYIFCQDL